MATGTGAHTAADGKPPFPPFQKETFPSQLVSFAIAFIALYLIVSRLVKPRVGGTIDARRNAIEGDLAAAQRAKDEADEAIKSYERELAEARTRAQAIASETRERLAAQSAIDRKTLEDRLAAKLGEAEKSIASTRQSAMANVKDIAADAASAIVQRMTGQAPDGSAVQAAVAQSLKN